uniref:Uncharacterized protein n=1 Tax=Anguilla anguilla TaxID=7936 RepID=A0A0E9U425_ANGAN
MINDSKSNNLHAPCRRQISQVSLSGDIVMAT